MKKFVPYDLRRTTATRVRAALSKEAAKTLLGYVTTDTTDIYMLYEAKQVVKTATQLDALGG